MDSKIRGMLYMGAIIIAMLVGVSLAYIPIQ